MLYGGLATLTGKLLLDLTTDNERTVTYGSYYGSINVDQKRSTITGYLIGGGLVLASIPVKIGFSKKIRKAVELLNSDVKSADVSFFDSESVILDSNGVGLRVTF